ncbi:MAG: nuclear transport factor 2 family protein [Calditrichaeota bacterium]|nr:nuclear transport factor 2 family protein [Calditrichota bacterium]
MRLDTDRINSIIDRIDQALIDRNASVLEQYYSDQLKMVAPNGMILSKEQLIAPFRDKNRSGNLAEIKSTDRKFNFFDRTAIVILKTSHRFKNKSQTDYKNSLVFILENDQWRLVLQHTTIIGTK